MSYGKVLNEKISKSILSEMAIHGECDLAFASSNFCEQHINGLSRIPSDARDTCEYSFRTFIRSRHTQLGTKLVNGTGKKDDRQQQLFEDFPTQYMTPKYAILKAGTIVLVRAEDLTATQCRDKAIEYRSQAGTMYAHADELDRRADFIEAEDLVPCD